MIGFRLPNGQQIELAPGATIALEINNALLAEADNNGSYVLPVTAPRTPNNELALDFAGLLDSPDGPQRRIDGVQAFDDDEVLAVGTLLLLKVTPSAFELSLFAGISAVMAKLKGRKLRDFSFGGRRTILAAGAAAPVPDPYRAHMNAVMAAPADFDYVFAPVSNNDFIEADRPGFPRRANFNKWWAGIAGFMDPGFLWETGYFPGHDLIPGMPFPGFYPDRQLSCVPFPKLAYVVQTMLQEMSIPLEEDFFDAETEQLVIIGNTAVDDPRSNREARTLDAAVDGLTFHIGDVLPDITAHELLRALADTFYLDLSISPIGQLRLRRSTSLLEEAPARSLTAQATPGYIVNVPEKEEGGMATAYRTDRDSYAQTRYQVIDSQMRGADAATVSALAATPEFEHEICLVVDEEAFYQHDGTGWKFYSIHLPTVVVGTAGETARDVLQGIDLVLEQDLHTEYLLPLPGLPWPPVGGTEPAFAVMRCCVFGEQGYSPTHNARSRSQAVRLGFYRGRQPYLDASQGTFPLLTQTNLDMQGNRLGNYTLRLDGPDGTVARWGRALLELRQVGDSVTWPVWLNADQINQLDLARRYEIDGIHVVVKKINVTFPIRKPAELQLVVVRPKALLS